MAPHLSLLVISASLFIACSTAAGPSLLLLPLVTLMMMEQLCHGGNKGFI